MEVEIQFRARVKELSAKKKKLISSMKRAKRSIVKSRVEKDKVDAELKKLKSNESALSNMTPEQARAHVLNEMNAVTPENIYPKDLEREFERIDKPRSRTAGVNEREVLDLDMRDDDDNDDASVSGRQTQHQNVGDDDDDDGGDREIFPASTQIVGDQEGATEEDGEVVDLSNE